MYGEDESKPVYVYARVCVFVVLTGEERTQAIGDKRTKVNDQHNNLIKSNVSESIFIKDNRPDFVPEPISTFRCDSHSLKTLPKSSNEIKEFKGSIRSSWISNCVIKDKC